MNFYQAQDNAKKKTRYLIFIYVLVLAGLTFISSLLLLLLVPISLGRPIPNPFFQELFSPEHLPTFLAVGAFIVGGALISSYVKSRHLAKGGGVVAASLGGSLITPNSLNLSERKVLNVVEEMAIASGMPVPQVYLLKQESGINAFAAGLTPSDAVIGVTQGCIDKLTRAQLQGVIGHEFSHILNGDMRLNLRIIMLLHGIEFVGILGRILTSSQRRSRYSSRRRGKSNGGVVLVGLALRLIGWFGVLSGNLIQAAVSRQREFLADASSVQFTRDPTAISGALKVIGFSLNASKINHADVNETAHIFFGQSFRTRLTSIFATHPPIKERIKCLEPSWDGNYIQPLEPPAANQTEAIGKAEEISNGLPADLPQPLAVLMAAGLVLEHFDEQQQIRLTKLAESCDDVMEAMALILAVLIDHNFEIENSNLQAFLGSINIEGLDKLIVKQVTQIKALGLSNTLPLVEMCMPALKQMSAKQYEQYKRYLDTVMNLDGEHSVFEKSLLQLVTRYLDVHFGLSKTVKVRYKKAKQVAMELQLLFSVLAEYGHGSGVVEDLSAQMAYEKSMHFLGLGYIQKMQLGDTHQATFESTIQKLIYCSLELKQQIANAMSLCVEHDGEVNTYEKELVLAIAATIDVPLPRLKH